MLIKDLVVGPIGANCIILGCETTRQAAVIDPGDDADRILKALADEKLTVTAIINTHGHFDHVGANKRLKEATGAEIMIHEADASMLQELSVTAMAFGLRAENSPPADRLLADGDTITFGEKTLTVLHTPGHTPGGVTFYCKDEKTAFAGDTLFYGSIGRTDLPGGNYGTLISSIKNQLFALPDDTVVYTGHGPKTTIGTEKQYNPFLK
ncbi:MBL fold metallo-hydrolase [Desulfoluna limicola]|uniref:MBL fold metallo-hydrolase n=1 Tax=Desulfoluna limicola TaxID=2810562 RepID=A0ABM7PLR1_9BACT|nr:MBL fold metallo-hydrolase [Desulfoluna limicola]BCS98028.1 MBL fold metallo-hydrolase [Desulfoluna limicola]